ncbi:unnamed protein product [Paramecium sonneborni]|uniref:Transmembrane protein n=1 Tax=Paramecium sonneborni TaxID=65129 RepID=A0A8S1RMX9_9CILI|nr:unnamed protein product [Paramecium sonneborni]
MNGKLDEFLKFILYFDTLDKISRFKTISFKNPSYDFTILADDKVQPYETCSFKNYSYKQISLDVEIYVGEHIPYLYNKYDKSKQQKNQIVILDKLFLSQIGLIKKDLTFRLDKLACNWLNMQYFLYLLALLIFLISCIQQKLTFFLLDKTGLNLNILIFDLENIMFVFIVYNREVKKDYPYKANEFIYLTSIQRQTAQIINILKHRFQLNHIFLYFSIPTCVKLFFIQFKQYNSQNKQVIFQYLLGIDEISQFNALFQLTLELINNQNIEFENTHNMKVIIKYTYNFFQQIDSLFQFCLMGQIVKDRNIYSFFKLQDRNNLTYLLTRLNYLHFLIIINLDIQTHLQGLPQVGLSQADFQQNQCKVQDY